MVRFVSHINVCSMPRLYVWRLFNFDAFSNHIPSRSAYMRHDLKGPAPCVKKMLSFMSVVSSHIANGTRAWYAELSRVFFCWPILTQHACRACSTKHSSALALGASSPQRGLLASAMVPVGGSATWLSAIRFRSTLSMLGIMGEAKVTAVHVAHNAAS